MRWGRRKEPDDWLKPEVVPLSSEEIGIKNSVFRTEVAVKGRADLMPKTPGSLSCEKY